MRNIYLTAFLLLASFPAVGGRSRDQSISLPSPDDVYRITIEPRSMNDWYTPESLLEVLPCLVPSQLTYLPKQPFQWGAFELKGGYVLRWMAANKDSLLILTDRGEQLFVLSPQCAGLQEGASQPDPVLLDISRRGIGMGPRRRPLYFRLNEGGRLEYEVFSKTEPGSPKYVLARKEIQLSEAVVKELIGLAERPDFLDASGEYPRLRIMKDSGIVTTIVYRRQGLEKKVVIVNYDPQHPRAESYYPASLRRLLARVDELRPKDE